MALVTAACVIPTTLGTGTGAGPVDITRFTAVPGFSSVPANGLSLITFPAATVPLDCGGTVPTVSPAPGLALVAADCVNPTTLGTGTCAGPVDTTRFTAVPGFSSVPANGLSLITFPAATVPLDCGVTVPTVSPAAVIALVAAACVNPTTLGTATCAGPVDTTRFTAVPKFSSVPANGLSLITCPAATVPLDCGVTVPTVSPAAVIALVAAACVNPTTFGTGTCVGPVDTTRCAA